MLAVLLVAIQMPLAASPMLLGDISFDPDAPVIGLDSIFLDNFTDAADLGCSLPFPACGGVDISGVLSILYQDLSGNTHTSLISVGWTGPGSTPIYEFDPTQITFESAVLTGTISPTSFPIDGGATFVSSGTFTSDTLTANNGFADISVQQTTITTTAPEPAEGGLILGGLMLLGTALARRRTG